MKTKTKVILAALVAATIVVGTIVVKKEKVPAPKAETEKEDFGELLCDNCTG